MDLARRFTSSTYRMLNTSPPTSDLQSTLQTEGLINSDLPDAAESSSTSTRWSSRRFTSSTYRMPLLALASRPGSNALTPAGREGTRRMLILGADRKTYRMPLLALASRPG